MINYEDSAYINDVTVPTGERPINTEIPQTVSDEELAKIEHTNREMTQLHKKRKYANDGGNNIPFWADDPNILFNQKYIFEFFPVSSMTYSQKMNAITRTVMLLSIVGFLVMKTVRLLFISIITVFAIYLVYNENQKDKNKNLHKMRTDNTNIENFNIVDTVLQQNGLSVPTDSSTVFNPPNDSNPLNNVLIPDYDYNTHKKPSPPSYNSIVNDNILTSAKRLVEELNPDQPDISDKLFKDLGDQFTFEQSLMPFYSTANTTIPNDQGGFADFCFGSMVSCKEGNLFACARNLTSYKV